MPLMLHGAGWHDDSRSTSRYQIALNCQLHLQLPAFPPTQRSEPMIVACHVRCYGLVRILSTRPVGNGPKAKAECRAGAIWA